METKEEKKQIHKLMTISDILGYFPNKAGRLSQEITHAGLHCVGCHAATWETLEGGMLGHGKSPEQIDQLVDRLNALLEEETDLTTISLTEEAAKKFLEFAALEGQPDAALRFGVEMKGCSGFGYILDFSSAAKPDDVVFESQGIQIHVNNKEVNKLIGCKIDYLTGLHDSGFKVIDNPNAKSSCSCGSSVGY